MQEKQLKGRVKWFNDTKGFGFIESDDMEGDVFVHYKEIQSLNKGFRTLKEGQQVGFEVTQDQLGRMKALNVVLL